MSRLNPRVQLIIILTALAFIPLIYASLLVWSVKDPTGSLDTMSAAIVNEDSPATIDDEELTLGDDLTDELLDSDDGFAWETMSQSAADTALEDGDIRAILTIPEDFSASAASLGDDDPLEAAKSQLTITTNDASNMIVGNIAATVGETVRTTVSQQVGEEFLNQVTVGFNDIAEALTDAADGAHELSDGTDSAHSGAGDLVVGLDALTDGAYDLSDGASQLAAGTAEASEGSTQLSDGLAELNDKTSGLPDTARTIDSEANNIAGRIQDLAGALDNAASEVTGIVSGLEDALDKAEGLKGTADNVLESADSLTDGTGGVATDSQELLEDWDNLSEDQRKAALQDIADDAGTAQDNVASVRDEAQSLADDASALLGDGSSTGLTGLSADSQDIQSILDEAYQGADKASEGSQLLYEGADRLTAASGTLVESADELSSAIGTASSASSELSDGLVTLRDGAAELDDGTDELVSGTTEAASGAGDLESGLGDLDEGANDLASGLDDGKDEVPTYTDEESDHLSSTASDPVELDDQRAHEVEGYGWGLAPYFMSLALWVGAMGYFLMRPALNMRQIVRSGSTLRAVISSITPAFIMAFIQSSLMVTLVRFGVGIDMADTAGVYALSFFASLTFFMINQMLIAALGPPGRFIALVMIVLQLSAAGGTYPIETAPEFLQRLHSWLPITHSVDGLRSLIAGGPFDTAGVLLPIAAWLLIGLLGLVAVVIVVSIKAHRPETKRQDDDQGSEEKPKRQKRSAKADAKHAG
ncbi:MAG TPA: YhgE/Pip domain-containing protein [Candidatus Yaniella excrementigallinarum]|nr:YhgE/Pip domain-containing protein [Candidatus Yaniella excrementigallinarum]